MKLTTKRKTKLTLIRLAKELCNAVSCAAHNQGRSSPSILNGVAFQYLHLLSCKTYRGLDSLHSEVLQGSRLVVELDAWQDAMRACDFVIKGDGANSVCVLLYGSPGTGKSMFGSLVKSKSSFEMERWVPTNKEDKRSDEDSSEPTGTIVLVDEIDRLNSEQITGLQNFIDDRRADVNNKTIIVLTTNNIDSLIDHPLCRRSRVDVISKCSGLTEDDRKRVCDAWRTPVLEGDTVAELVANCREAAVQKFLENKEENSEGAYDMIVNFLAKMLPDED